jgi:hypothetical protein
MKRSVLFLLVPLLAACNVHSKSSDDADDNVSINADESGHIAFNLPFMQGQVKVPGSMMHGGNFDIDGVKLMPGSSVGGFNLDAADHGSKVTISFKAPATPEATRAYFLDQFKEKGVEASPSRDGIAGTSKDGSPFFLHLSPVAGGTQGTIEVQDKD